RHRQVRPSTSPGMRLSIMPTKPAISGSMRPSTAPLRFVVDTGASTVTLTAADAAAAGISHSSLSYSIVTNTANGQGRAAPVRLREVRIGQLAINDVQAAVVDNLHMSLLGMSFLKRLERVEMGEGTLTIYWD